MIKQYDVLALSSVCVDIVIPVDELPPNDRAARQQLLQQLSADPPPQTQWELGGSCNFAIASSRLGMRTGVVGHVGNDVYGSYMEDVLQVRPSPSMPMSPLGSFIPGHNATDNINSGSVM